MSRLYIINIVRKPRTRYVVSNKHGVGVKSGRVKLQSGFFLKMMISTIRFSENEATISELDFFLFR